MCVQCRASWGRGGEYENWRGHLYEEQLSATSIDMARSNAWAFIPKLFAKPALGR
jgi:hypothetical protein